MQRSCSRQVSALCAGLLQRFAARIQRSQIHCCKIFHPKTNVLMSKCDKFGKRHASPSILSTAAQRAGESQLVGITPVACASVPVIQNEKSFLFTVTREDCRSHQTQMICSLVIQSLRFFSLGVKRSCCTVNFHCCCCRHVQFNHTPKSTKLESNCHFPPSVELRSSEFNFFPLDRKSFSCETCGL